MPSFMTPAEILETARAIASEYRRDGLRLTLRQLYYQFVARGLAPSSQKTYNRIGAVLTDARYRGKFPVDWVDDRGRHNTRGDFTRNDTDPDWGAWKIADFMHQAPEVYLARDRWFRQRNHVSVWVEKEALGGIVGDAASKKGVSWMACKGYPSVSALREWLASAWLACSGETYYTDACEYQTQEGTCEKCVVLYLGDHDPDGLEIPQAAERGLNKLMLVTGWTVPLEFRRIALSQEQIKRYNPPPFPAKQTSARFAKYVKTTGLRDAWELDALEPRLLRELIWKEVDALFDPTIQRLNGTDVYDARRTMRETVRDPRFSERALDGEAEEYDRQIPEAQELLDRQTRNRGIRFDDGGCPLNAWEDDADQDSVEAADGDTDDTDTDDSEED